MLKKTDAVLHYLFFSHSSCVAPWMAVLSLAGQSAASGPDRNVSATTGWIATKFRTDIHISQKIHPPGNVKHFMVIRLKAVEIFHPGSGGQVFSSTNVKKLILFPPVFITF